MGIKEIYTVKSGDRISYIASWYNVTTQEIIDATPAVFTPARIAATNALIAAGDMNPGEALIYAGDMLNIPTGENDERIEEKTIEAENSDDLAIYINNNLCPNPHEFEFNEYFDTCSDNFNLTYPHDPEIQNPVYFINIDDFKTKGLPDIKLYIGSDPVLTGSIEIPANKITASSSSQTLAGRTKTFLLEKSDLFPSIQREFIDLNLEEIAKIISRPYSINVVIDSNVDLGENFPKATIQDNEKPFTFISRLARERSSIVSNTTSGELLIRKAEQKSPVANFKIDSGFLEFIGIEGLIFTFDTTKIFGNYLGKVQTTDDDNLTEIVESSTLKQQSIKIINYNDADDKTLLSMTQWEEQKSIREFYENSIPYPSWINPNNGDRWKAGEIVTIQAIEAGIPEPIELIIRNIKFTKGSQEKRTALLNLLPVSVYI